MVVAVVIEAEGAGGLRPEQARVLGMLRHRLRHARAAHMPVEADDPVALRHDDVQVVGDEQHAETLLGPQLADQVVELGLARVVDAAHRLVEHQHVGRADQRACEQHPLQLAAGEIRQLAIADPAGADVGEHALDLLVLGPPPELHEARDVDRDGAVELEALRHVADDETRLAHGLALVRALEPQQHPHQRGLAGPVGADQRHDLARRDIDVDALQDGAARPRQPQRARADERTGIVRQGRTVVMRMIVVVVVAVVVHDRAGKRPIGSGQCRRLAARFMAFHARAPGVRHALAPHTPRTGP